MGKYTFDVERYKSLARQAVAEGCVLLKNENHTLPLKKGDKVAVFGRMAHEYYKSGLGSGGLVNTKYVTGILDALKQEKDIILNESILEIYEEFIKDNPHDIGKGWGKVPWCQKEMEVSDGLFELCTDCDAAIVVIGRTAGEDQDNSNTSGSYLLQKEEYDLIKNVSQRFVRTIVLLNVGNIIDMKWVDELRPAAVMYVWQGGQEGGNGVCDVLMGRVDPCGKLTDTIAIDIDDYPAYTNFGKEKDNIYEEDIYVGYRYFETFARDNVLYPFGFGLSYTSFDISARIIENDNVKFKLELSVENTGKVSGKEVVQVYVKAPQGVLGKPARVLVDFYKTKELLPGEIELKQLTIDKYTLASYDDSSITGYKSCYVLEAGTYDIFVGSDVRSAKKAGSFDEQLRVVQKLEEAYAPVLEYKRIRPIRVDENSDKYEIGFEDTPTRTVDWRDRVMDFPVEIPYTGDKGIKLGDVFYEKNSMDDFIAQLSDGNLMTLFRGEGMCSPKVTPGTGAAFGGLSESLRKFGIPALCCSDGPSGIRMDVGTKAFSLPNGTMLGCTFNTELVELLYQMTGKELRRFRIDALLGPGINIHRHPLNGRNFEYISEDPLLTGKMGAAQIRGLNIVGATGTIKHFCGNNQEFARRTCNSIISERALREIYLKGFEISIKEGHARAVMTTYGAVNGLWTAGSYDLNTTILRNEWGFKGIVMSDWWADANVEGEDANVFCHAPMVRAQNDLFMVCDDATNIEIDDVWSKLKSGGIFRCELQRNARNILEFALKSPAMLYELGLIEQEEIDEIKESVKDDEIAENIVYYKTDKHGTIIIDGCEIESGKIGNINFGIELQQRGAYDISITMHSQLDELAQLPVTVFYDSQSKFTAAFRGTNGRSETKTGDLGSVFGQNHYIKLYLGANGIYIDQIKIKLREEA